MVSVGRNSPCPCGSGKKFKKCCLKNNVKANKMPQIFYGVDDTGTLLECMVCDITNINKDVINERAARLFEVGDWYVVTGSCESATIHGPFTSVEASFSAASELTAAVSFTTTPTMNPI